MVAGNEDYWKVAIEFFPDSVISDMHKEVLKSIPIGGRDGGSTRKEVIGIVIGVYALGIANIQIVLLVGSKVYFMTSIIG